MTKSAVTVEDQYALPYSREYIWEKLNDPVVLAACIKGCVRVERVSPKQFKAVIRAHVGEIKKDFNIVLNVQDDQAPAAYCLSSDVSAGLFGKVNGEADVALEVSDDTHTRLKYIARIDGRGLLGKALPLIEGAARARVRDFFDQFVAHL